jgi:hypothetical protein
LTFDAQLKVYLNSIDPKYSTAKIYSTLHVLCENKPLFHQWINVERQSYQKKVDAMLNSLNSNSQSLSGDLANSSNESEALNKTKPTHSILENDKSKDSVWSCLYADVDSLKTPYCAESFMLMVKSIKG